MTAFVVFGVQISWVGVLIALACCAGVIVGAMLRKYQEKELKEYYLSVAVCCLFAILGSRMMYWYCNTALYSSFFEIFTSRDAGQSLGGALFGVVCAIVVTGLIIGFKEIPAIADCISVASMAAIFIGRLSGFFNSSDRGRMIFNSPILQRLPFAVEIEVGNELTEWRFATFFFEAIFAALIFVCASNFFSRVYANEKKGNEGLPLLLVCSMYGASQAVLESTRYDSLFLRFNGFVSLVQTICAVLVVGAAVTAFVLCVRANLNNNALIMSFVSAIVFVGCAGGLEYLVQRYARYYPLWYLLMSVTLGLASWLTYKMLNTYIDRGEKNSAELKTQRV